MIARNIIIVRILETIVMYSYVSFSKSKDTKKDNDKFKQTL